MSLDTTPTLPSREPAATIRLRQFVESLCDRLLRPGRHWVFASVAIYALACLLPAVPPIFGDNPLPGWFCVAVLFYTFLPWWANPTYYIAVIASLLNRARIAVVFAIVAALLAVSYELMGFYEKGVASAMKELLPGCLLWIASLQLLACHELWRQWLDWQRRQECLERGPDESVEASPVQSSSRQ